MAETVRIRGLAVPDSKLVVDADLELAGRHAGVRRSISIDEVCSELIRSITNSRDGDLPRHAESLAASVLAAFPPVRQVSITVWNHQPVLDGATAEKTGVTVSLERGDKRASQGASQTRPRPR